ncbi:MAG: hypothetical protein LBB24_02470 [Rickettsiales bacterium]|nr:hypothetical protein [Rickettsiales bacterium]
MNISKLSDVELIVNPNGEDMYKAACYVDEKKCTYIGGVSNLKDDRTGVANGVGIIYSETLETIIYSGTFTNGLPDNSERLKDEDLRLPFNSRNSFNRTEITNSRNAELDEQERNGAPRAGTRGRQTSSPVTGLLTSTQESLPPPNNRTNVSGWASRLECKKKDFDRGHL